MNTLEVIRQPCKRASVFACVCVFTCAVVCVDLGVFACACGRQKEGCRSSTDEGKYMRNESSNRRGTTPIRRHAASHVFCRGERERKGRSREGREKG